MPAKTIYSEAYRQLVQDLRVLREQGGLSQTALSERLGWPQQRLSAVEAGARRLDVLEFLQLVRALGLTPEAGIGLVARAEAKAPASRPSKRTRS